MPLYPATNPTILNSGWISANETWTYASADTPTYTFTVAADVTTKYSAGMKVMFTQTQVKYGIITAVSTFSGGNTTITVCMSMTSGTVDNSGLANAAISANFYSTMKAPYSFPIDPLRWTLEDTDNTEQSQSSPTQNVWYNVGTNTLAVPIGAWDLGYEAIAQFVKTTQTVSSIYATLSTANNSNSDPEFQCNIYAQVLQASTASVFNLVTRHKVVNLAAKTTYYLNLSTEIASAGSIEFRGDRGVTKIRAVLAYL